MQNTRRALLVCAALAGSQPAACSSDHESASDAPTWNRDIAPLVGEK